MRGGRDHPVAPTHDDPVVGALSEGVGGRLGRHAAGHRWWTPVRVLLALTAVCFALGMLQKAPCWNDGWADGEQRYAAMCYSDLPYLYTGRGFAELAWPYTDDPGVRERYETMEYPVGISYFAWGAAWATHALSGFPDVEERAAEPAGTLFSRADVAGEVKLYVAVSAVLMAVMALLATWLLAGVNPGRPWDAAAFAVSPALLLTGLVNWDLLAVVLVAAALWTWARRDPLATGVLIGLGTATKLYPLFLLGAVLVICLRRRDWRSLALAAGGTVGAWLLANLPAYVGSPTQWNVFWTFNSERGPDLGSIWLVISQAGGTWLDAHAVNVGSWVFFVLWCAGVLVLGMKAPRSPRMAQLGFLIVAGFLLVNKVYSPQYVLWLLPLAVLARPRWRDLLIWTAGELFYFASVWWYLAGALEAGGGEDQPFYWLAILVRIAAELYLVAMVSRDVLLPARDPVPREGDAPLVPRRA